MDETLNVDGQTTLNGGVDLGNGTSDAISVLGLFDTNLIAGVGNLTLGSSGNQWQDLWLDGTAYIDILDVDETLNVDGQTTLNGGVDLGNGTSDAISVLGLFDTNLIAGVGNLTLGSSGNQWMDLWIDGTAHIDALEFGGTSMTVPNNTGTTGQVLTSNGSNSMSWTTVSGGGGSQTPWTSNIDANGFDLTGLDDITFNNGHTFKQNSAGLTMNVLASNDYIKLNQANSTRLEITNTGGVQISSGLGATALLELRTGNGSYTPFSMGDGVNTTLGVGGNDDLIFKEGSATVCTYSGTLDKWLFTGGSGGFNISVNGVQKILFGNDINITDEIQMSGDIDFASGNYPDLHDTTPTASSFAGYVIIKVKGVNKKLIYYDM